MPGLQECKRRAGIQMANSGDSGSAILRFRYREKRGASAMNKKLICILVILALMLSVQNVVGPATTSAGSSGGSGGSGGGGSKQVDIDRLLKAVEDGKKNKPE